MNTTTRRQFLALSATGLAIRSVPGARMLLAAPGPTVGAVYDRIRQTLGGDWKPDGPDGLKAGDPGRSVTGIVTTALASLAVLQAAVKAGANLVITSEPVFFSRADTPTPPALRFPGTPAPAADAPPDPVFAAKAKFIQDHGLAVLRLNEHWRAQQPSPLLTGLATDLRWTAYADKADPARITLPAMRLDALAPYVKAHLGSRGGLRVIGDRALPVHTVGLLPGSTAIQAALDTLPHVDALLVGEVREWEAVEYVRDTVDLHGKKALLYVGRIVSEEPGMRACAAWLKTVVPEVPTTFHSAGDPYWRP